VAASAGAARGGRSDSVGDEAVGGPDSARSARPVAPRRRGITASSPGPPSSQRCTRPSYGTPQPPSPSSTAGQTPVRAKSSIRRTTKVHTVCGRTPRALPAPSSNRPERTTGWARWPRALAGRGPRPRRRTRHGDDAPPPSFTSLQHSSRRASPGQRR
jgi:hypothetical protein